MRKTMRVLGSAFVMLMTSAVVQAEPFTILANGDLVFNTSLSTAGSFTCGTVVSCIGSGSSITLQSGEGTATLSFTSATASFAAGNTTVPVTLGTFEGSTTGDFSLPNLNPGERLFLFTLTLSHSSPVVASAATTWGFNPNLTRCCEQGFTNLGLPVGPQPPQYSYSSIIYEMRVVPLSLPGNGSKDLVADVGVVPEPTSMVLAGTGLIAAFFRRRKRT